MNRRVRAVSMARSEYRRGPPPPAAPPGRPGSDRFRGQPHRHIAAANEGLVIGRPVRHAVLRLIRGMNLRLHPGSVTPAEARRTGQTAPPTEGHSCNNALLHRHVEFPPAGSPQESALTNWRVVGRTMMRQHPGDGTS